MYFDDITYTYLYQELSGDPKEAKVGHGSGRLFKRVGEQQTGNPRALIPIIAVIGDFDAEFKRTFAPNRFGTGGEEWYIITPELLNFFYDKMVAAVNAPLTTLSNKEFGNGPAKLDVVELGRAEPRTLVAVRGQGQIPAYDIAEAPQPKSHYARLEKSKQ